MTIPMPGHMVEEKNQTEVKATLELLTKLIEEHDVLYLGLDSREARWLPTVIAAAKGKVPAIPNFLGHVKDVILQWQACIC